MLNRRNTAKHMIAGILALGLLSAGSPALAQVTPPPQSTAPSSVLPTGGGAALLDAGLRRLHDNGVNGCVIDWTTLIGFYGKFGFEQYREYAMMGRAL